MPDWKPFTYQVFERWADGLKRHNENASRKPALTVLGKPPPKTQEPSWQKTLSAANGPKMMSEN